jgi:hypothetical protein
MNRPYGISVKKRPYNLVKKTLKPWLMSKGLNWMLADHLQAGARNRTRKHNEGFFFGHGSRRI